MVSYTFKTSVGIFFSQNIKDSRYIHERFLLLNAFNKVVFFGSNISGPYAGESKHQSVFFD